MRFSIYHELFSVTIKFYSHLQSFDKSLDVIWLVGILIYWRRHVHKIVTKYEIADYKCQQPLPCVTLF